MLRKSKEELTILIKSIFLLSGSSENTAKRVTEALVSSSLAGVDSHGIWQIIRYSNDLKIKDYNGTIDPTIISETSSTATISGHWNFGHLGAKLAIETAIKKAKNTTIALVGLIQAGHIGRLGEYAEIAAKENMCSMIMGGGYGVETPRAIPYGGREAILHTNPIAIGFPIANQTPFIMDYATTSTAGSKINKAAFKNETIPLGHLVDKDGIATQDASQILKGGSQVPFGEHKGYALMVAIELFGRILTGADQYANTTEFNTATGMRYQGVSFIVFKADSLNAINIVNEKASDLRKNIRNIPPAKGFDQVLVPGDLEEKARLERSIKGIPVEREIWDEMVNIHEKLLKESKKK